MQVILYSSMITLGYIKYIYNKEAFNIPYPKLFIDPIFVHKVGSRDLKDITFKSV